MLSHEEKIERICTQLKDHTGTTPLSLEKSVVSHEVPKPGEKRWSDEKIDVSGLTEILHIDSENLVCEAESGVTFVDLVEATLKYGLAPIIVPELKTITIGVAVAGCSIELMSYKHGGFHDVRLEYEVVTAEGEVLVCTPMNKHQEIFQMVHGTFGTLGIITKLKFRLIPAKPYVDIRYEKYTTLEGYKAAIWHHFEKQDIDFMDAIIHNLEEYVLSVGNITDFAPYTNHYGWMKIYYKSTKERTRDYLRTPDYFFRYDQGVTGVGPESFLGRLLFGRLLLSSNKLKLAKVLRRFLPESIIPITQDLFIPFKNLTAFLNWYRKQLNYFPLWCVPYRPARDYEWIDDTYMDRIRDPLFIGTAKTTMQSKD